MTTTFDETMDMRREARSASLTLKGMLGTPDLAEWSGERAANDTHRAARRRKLLWPGGTAFLGVGAVLALTAWHFLPLHHRVEVANTTASPMRGVILRVGNEEIAAGDLAPGQRFGHTFFQRRKLGSSIEAYAMIDGHKQSLGRCGNGVLSSTHTHVSLRGTTSDGGLDCRDEQPGVGRLP